MSVNVTQLFKRSQTKFFLAAHFAKRNTKFGGGGKRGRAKIPSPQPPSFLPARAFSLAREARHQFRSKKVRTLSYNCTRKEKSKSFGSPRGVYPPFRRTRRLIRI